MVPSSQIVRCRAVGDVVAHVGVVVRCASSDLYIKWHAVSACRGAAVMCPRAGLVVRRQFYFPSFFGTCRAVRRVGSAAAVTIASFQSLRLLRNRCTSSASSSSTDGYEEEKSADAAPAAAPNALLMFW